MSSKYEVICGNRPAAVEDLLEGVEVVCTLSSSEVRDIAERRPRDEPATANVSSSVKDSKLCAGSICGMLNKS